MSEPDQGDRVIRSISTNIPEGCQLQVEASLLASFFGEEVIEEWQAYKQQKQKTEA